MSTFNHSTFYSDGFQDGSQGYVSCPPDAAVYASEYRAGYRDGSAKSAALTVMTTLRNRSMYGDNYVEGQPHVFISDSWLGTSILDAAASHIEHGIARQTSAVAVWSEYCQFQEWCAAVDPETGSVRSDLLCAGSSINDLGGFRVTAA